MNSKAGAPVRIGRCTRVDGEAMIGTGGGSEKPLLPDTALRAGDKITAGIRSAATLTFADGTIAIISDGGVFSIDGFAFESDHGDDMAYFSLSAGIGIVDAGDLAIGAGDFTVMCGECTLSLRGARIVVCVDPVGYDLITLLPSVHGPQGEVLAHNKIGMQMLNRPWQTLRLGGDDADIPAPLTLPSGVVADTYAGTGMAEALFPADVENDTEHLSEEFQPFRALQDRLLERQFIARQVFPNDGPVKSGDGDAFVEDAFEGTRFRLADSGPETTD